MTYADAYRLAHILDEQMQRLLDGDGVEADALAEAHKIAVKWCAEAAMTYVVGEMQATSKINAESTMFVAVTGREQAVVATDKPRRGAKRKRPPVIQEDPCPRCLRTGQAFYVRASGQRTAYCVECANRPVPPGSNVNK